MMPTRARSLPLWLWLAVALVALAPTAALEARPPRLTALDRYVHAPDPTYSFSTVSTTPGDGYTTTVLEMKSQQWLTSAEVDRTVWTHWLTVITPDTVKHRTVLLFIGGGNNGAKPPERPNPLFSDIAKTTGSVVVELRMVPNQPLTFAGETRPRREDEMIAYSWDKFLRTGDERWPARLPMTKAVVRAMDTITTFCQQKNTTVDRFVVAGASKRGWTAWTTAAVDPRVVALIPMVIDLLNLEPSFVHHWRAYGFWAPAIKDYEDLRIMDWMDTPQYRALRQIEDPYEYRDRLTLPKFLINAAGDQFFLPDSWRFYFHDLKGEKYLRYVPNTDHSLKDSDAPQSMAAFYAAVLTNTPRPQFDWSVEKDGTIRARTRTKPESVTLWRAVNAGARDFRLDSIGGAYKSTPLADRGDGVYEARPETPAKGWAAAFIELRFSSGSKYPLVFTTGVSVTPRMLPFDAPKPARAPKATRAPSSAR